MNLTNFKNWKFWAGAGLSVAFLVGGAVLHISGGFFRELVAVVAYLLSGALAGFGAYYIFIEKESY